MRSCYRATTIVCMLSRSARFVALVLCGLFAARGQAMEAPDSLGLARLAKLAGPPGSARMRVQRAGQWVAFAGVMFDATGLRARVPGQAVAPVTDTWTEAAPAMDIAWSSITRLQVQRHHGHSRAPVVGAVIGGLSSAVVITGWPEGTALRPLESLGVFAMFATLGALAGKGVSAINPLHAPEWRDFP
jgi:hypothetical protein